MAQPVRNPKQLGEVIRRHRHLKGINQSILGDLAGVRQATVSQIEHGSPATRAQTLFDVLAALNLEIEVKDRSGSPVDIESIF